MKIFIITHGLLAQGLIDSAQLIIGEQENLKAISLTAETNIKDFKEKIENEMSNLSEDILCFTDIVNGSPFNTMAPLTLKYPNLYHICGVNLPMVLEAALFSGEVTDELVEKLVNAGSTAIFDAGAFLKQKLNEEI